MHLLQDTRLGSSKTLIESQGISLTTEKATAGQVDHGRQCLTLDPQLRGCALVQQNKHWASSSVHAR